MLRWIQVGCTVVLHVASHDHYHLEGKSRITVCPPWKCRSHNLHLLVRISNKPLPYPLTTHHTRTYQVSMQGAHQLFNITSHIQDAPTHGSSPTLNFIIKKSQNKQITDLNTVTIDPCWCTKKKQLPRTFRGKNDTMHKNYFKKNHAQQLALASNHVVLAVPSVNW